MRKTSTTLAFCCIFFLDTRLPAQADLDFAELIAIADERVEQSLVDYQAFLSSTGTERLELVTAINKIENELVQFRSAERLARQEEQVKKLQLEELKSIADSLDTQIQYSAGVLSEYLTNFESRIHISEDQKYSNELLAIRSELESAGDASDARIPALFEAVEAGLDRQESLVGGHVFEGSAITPEGGIKPGVIVLFGPVAYFQAQDLSATGVLQFNSGTIEPGLIPVEPEDSARLAQLLETGSGSLPLDASLGKAFALKSAKGSLIEHIDKGGWVGYAILLLGAFSIFIVILKAIDLKTSRLDDPGNLRDVARAALTDSAGKAKSMAASIKGPVSTMVSTGVEFVRSDTETISEAMEAVILRHRPKLERFLPFLATTAAVAPLMGLLGTVVGMIKTFTLIEVFGTGDAKSLSSGISEALITTELGLIVAIPALVFHGIFTRIMRSRIGTLEQVAADFSRHVTSIRTQG